LVAQSKAQNLSCFQDAEEVWYDDFRGKVKTCLGITETLLTLKPSVPLKNE